MVNSLVLVGSGVAILAIVLVVVYTIMIYNGLVRLRRTINEAMSNIEVLMKQRNQELPDLVDTAQQYMQYEEDLMNEITEARNQAQQASSPAQMAQAEEEVREALGNFFAVAEEYPDLKATKQFQKIQRRISELETNIADRREVYNQAVNTYNIRINQIPYNVVAAAMGYTEEELFEAEEGDLEAVDIDQEFQR